MEPKFPDKDARLTKLEIIDFLAPRNRRSYEDDRQTRDRIRKLIDYAIEKKKFPRLWKDGYRFNDVVVWAIESRTLRDSVKGVPHVIERALPLSVTVLEGATLNAVGIALPSSLPECQEKVRELSTTLAQRDIEIKNLKSEILKLKPDADKYREIRSMNALNGRKGGRGRAR